MSSLPQYYKDRLVKVLLVQAFEHLVQVFESIDSIY